MSFEAKSKPGSALVVGLGVSGRAVCELLVRQGARVIATDMRKRGEFGGSLDSLERAGCTLRLGGHETADFLGVDQIIVSPGVPLDIPELEQARGRGKEILGELEWAWRQVNVPVVAVTGTNGKTTTTSLVGEMFKAAGKNAFVGGNIGTPLSRKILEGGSVDALVLEASSFQLDTAPTFRPDTGVLLNVTEDHLDRYRDFDEYADSKFSIFSRQDASCFAVVNLDDPVCRSRVDEVRGTLLTAARKDPGANASISGRDVVVKFPGMAPFMVSLTRSGLRGVHNEENVLCAVLAAAAMGIPVSAMQQAIDSYKVLPHRVEWVGEWNGIDFYDDSKGTNVGAVVKAVEGFDRPLLLLLGGRDKLGAYEPLVAAMKSHGKAALAFGESAPRIQAELGKHIRTRSFPGLGEAFDAAISMASRGDIVLLSPACSSFDQYTGYAQRGDHFKQLVNTLTHTNRTARGGSA